jgi:endonuclease/exonuclease/phosphatase family metal-dependent hydrolase
MRQPTLSRLAPILAATWTVSFLTPLVSSAQAPAVSASRDAHRSLKLATWNLEWLIAPAKFHELKASCAPKSAPVRGDVRKLPCDVVTRFERSSRDFAMLERYARALDADVIALQEVDGADAARLVFPAYEFCFTSRRHVQNTGFAIRKGIAYRCGTDARELALNDSVRRGAELVLFPGEQYEMHLLSVHLKSGCTSKPLDSPDRDCRDLGAQVPALERWIDARARAQHRFAVLGDFNRDLLAEEQLPAGISRTAVWPNLDDADPPESDLTNAASGQLFRNCVPGQRYRSYIDYIVLSRTLGLEMEPRSFSRVTYTAADARHARLSDHCPVSVRLNLSPSRQPGR